jgi:hypothetical protein
MKFIDPYSNPEEFEDPKDVEFLKELLWEINKYLLPGVTEEQRKWAYKEHEREILSNA